MRKFALILAGGEGARLFPLSTPEKPKQFLELYGSKSLLAHTWTRIQPLFESQNIYIATHRHYAHWVKKQLPQVPEAQLILESHKRNTAPCIAFAAKRFFEFDQNSVMGVFQADHHIGDEDRYRTSVQQAFKLAGRHPKLITGGVQPTVPSTEYGYIKVGDVVPNAGDLIYEVECFIEKPDKERAEGFCAGGRYLWHSGPFIWSTRVILKEISQHLSKLHTLLGRTDDFFERSPNISIDHGILEHSKNVWIFKGEYPWSDLGSFEAINHIKSIQF